MIANSQGKSKFEPELFGLENPDDYHLLQGLAPKQKGWKQSTPKWVGRGQVEPAAGEDLKLLVTKT